MSNELATTHPQEMRVVEQGGHVAVASMMHAIIEKGITAENVSALEGLSKLLERQQDKQAEQEFNRAFAQLQNEIPAVRADKDVSMGNGSGYSYCSYEEILKQAQPIMTRHGFAVKFSQDLSDGKVKVTCKLIHEGGHSEENNYSVRVSAKGAPGMNETKMDASASTVAQREAFCDALNIVRRGREEQDERMQGDSITGAQAVELQSRVRAMGGFTDEGTFLSYAHGVKNALGEKPTPKLIAETYAAIPAHRLEELEKLLARKEEAFKRGDDK